MKFDIVNLKGSKVSDLNADSNVFGIEPNIGAIRQAVLSEMTNMRQGTHSTKIGPMLKVVEKSLGSKKGEVLQELVLFVLLCGKVGARFSVLSHMIIIINCLKD